MKRPRPVSSAASSTRGIDWPTQGEPLMAMLSAMSWLAASAIPKHPPAHLGCVRRSYSAGLGRPAIPADLKTYHPVSFSRMCGAASARETGDIPELARADAGMVAEEAREMRRLGKAELLR